MPVPISVTGFKNLAGDQNVHAEIAETASAARLVFQMRGGGDVEKTSTTATMDVDDETARDDDGNARRKRPTLGHRGERFRLFLPRHRWRADSRLRTSHQRDEFAPETWVVLFTPRRERRGEDDFVENYGRETHGTERKSIDTRTRGIL